MDLRDKAEKQRFKQAQTEFARMGVTLKYNSEYEEYGVRLRGSGKDSEYLTSDLDDAISNARFFAGMGKQNPQSIHGFTEVNPSGCRWSGSSDWESMSTRPRSRNTSSTSSLTPSGRTARMMRRRNPIGQEYFIDPVKGKLFSAAQALKMLPKYPSSVKFALQMKAGEDPVAAGGVLAVAAAETKNSKTGDCYVTSSAQQSCPNGQNNVYRCPFLEGNGCYAENDNQGNWTRILNKTAEAAQADSLTVAKAEAAAIEKLAAYLNTYEGGPKKLLRLHIVGDAVTAEAAQLLSDAAKPFIRRNAQIPTLFSANQEGRLIGNGGRGDSKVWAYTHGWRSVPRSAWGDVSILASCETSEDLEEAYSKGYALSAVVKKYDNEHLWDSSKEPQRWKAYEKYGFIMLPCPNEAGGPKKAPGVEKCVTCGLCLKENMLRDKRMVIAFETHGSRTKRIDEVLVQIGANL